MHIWLQGLGIESVQNKGNLQRSLFCKYKIAQNCISHRHTTQYAILNSSFSCGFYVIFHIKAYHFWRKNLCSCQCLYPVLMVEYIFPLSVNRVNIMVHGSYSIARPLLFQVFACICVSYYWYLKYFKIQDSRFKHRLFRRNTDIHIYITIMDTWQNMFLNGNLIWSGDYY